MTMLKAFVIEPKTRGKLCCKNCGLEYTHKDYAILYDVSKLMYFRYKRATICNGCLPSVAASTREAAIKIVDVDGTTKTMKFRYDGE
jgi:hypothetical protein